MYFQLPSFIKRWHWQHSQEKNSHQTGIAIQPSVVVFSGAGLSAESGIATFRGKSTVWNSDQNMRFLDSDIIHEDLAGFLAFHNARRREMLAVTPNAAHQALAELQQQFQVAQGFPQQGRVGSGVTKALRITSYNVCYTKLLRSFPRAGTKLVK